MAKRQWAGTVCAGLVLLLFPALAAGQPASLLLDINRTTLDEDFPPHVESYGLQAAGNRLFFLANAGHAGYEVWTSDGTSAGTQIVRDLCPGPCDADASLFGALGNVMLWSTGQTQLWRSDGTRPGTFALTGPDVNLQAFGASTTAFFRGSFYFGVCPGAGFNQDCDLWRTDGSVGGTRIFHRSPHVFEWLFVAGDKLYFLKGDDQGADLWVTNGTAQGTVRLRHFADGPNLTPHGAVSAGGRLFFLARDGGSEQVWTSDGTAAGTRKLTSFPGSEPLGTFPWLKPEGNRVYFLADDSLHGLEIWRSDGTVTGTVRVTDLMDDSPFTRNGPEVLTEVGGVVIFRASDPRSPSPLWMSHGTPESTAPFPLCTSCALDPYTGLIDSGGKAFFLLYPASGRLQLGVTDGTAAGSRALRFCDYCSVDALRPWKGGLLLLLSASSQKPQIWFSDGTPKGTGPSINLPGRVRNDPLEVAEIGTRLYVLTTDGTPGLWVRDATGTTQPVFSFPRAEPTSEPRRLSALGNRLLFTAWDGASPFDLWSSAGTPETTSRSSLPPEIDWNDAATGLVSAAGLLFFQIRQDFSSFDLWRTDGTRQGTFVVAHLTDTNPAVMVPYQGKLYFFDDAQIWQTDGTPQGTVKTGDFPADLAAVEVASPGPNGICLKTVTNPYHTEFWFTDGTTAGTRQLTHFNPPGVTGWPPKLTSFGSNVYFSWFDGLYKTDGTPQGTTRVWSTSTFEAPTQLAVFQGALYFFTAASSSEIPLRLWRTDGTPAGTVQISQFPGQDVFNFPVQLTPFAGKLFFNVDDGVHGIELWATDGTPAGTALVRDLDSGPLSSKPTQLTVAGGRLFFTAGDDVHGVELWQSDGTADGTRLVQDIAPQAFSSNPAGLTVAGDNLYFTADDGVRGREVWVLPLSGSTACRPSSTRLCLSGGRYAVEATWRDFQGHEGVGHAVALTPDTGYFWFFSDTNVEAVLKVLDGRPVNGHVWVYYGALSNVEYTLTVTDSETGLSHRYVNPSGELASVADTTAFGPLGASEKSAAVTTVAAPSPLALVEQRTVRAKAACAPSSTRLCLNGGRFAVEVAWKDFSGHTGAGQAVELTGDTGWFWFFSSTNVEVVLKVLDGTPVNGHHWVFYGALSNVEYTVTVTDTQTGQVKTYKNASGQLASIADVGAF